MKYNLKEKTKKELVELFKQKTTKASPMVKQVAHRGLMNLPKKELIRYVRHGRVTAHGDITFIQRKK
jgi:hypothetical protein